ncbi:MULTISPECIES: glutathione S-transferase family protein [Falsihalocynthiibacter]|uniref:glutathione S-transferase family protein n=1 Tax=Falsihalocynthiibacter TaxID=2854182 RepID=UPI003002246D
MTQTIIFSYPGACSRVTMTALEEIGAPYEVRWIDIMSQAQYASEYLAKNRKSKVPALVVEGTTLTENAAILNYLHTAHPQAKLLPQTGNAIEDTQGLSDLVWCGGMLHPMVRQIRAPQKWTKGSEAETAGIRADGMEKLAKECAYIEQRLAQAPWWYGADWSIVDTYLYWVVSTAAKSGFSTADYPAITAHSQQVRARPSFQRMLAREVAALSSDGIALDPTSL